MDHGQATVTRSGDNVTIDAVAYIHGPNNTPLDPSTLGTVVGYLELGWNGTTSDPFDIYQQNFNVTTNITPVNSPQPGAYDITYNGGFVPEGQDPIYKPGYFDAAHAGHSFTDPDRTHLYLAGADILGVPNAAGTIGGKHEYSFSHEFGHALGLADFPTDIGDMMDAAESSSFQLTTIDVGSVLSNTRLNQIISDSTVLFKPGDYANPSNYGYQGQGTLTFEAVGSALQNEVDGVGDGAHIFSDASLRSNGDPGLYNAFPGYSTNAIDLGLPFFNGEGLGDGVVSYSSFGGFWGTNEPGHHGGGLPQSVHADQVVG